MTPIMPENTTTPMACRISAPAPEEITKGYTPAMKAMDVIKIGRRRSLHASSAAETGFFPSRYFSRCFSQAYSTMRKAFSQTRPLLPPMTASVGSKEAASDNQATQPLLLLKQIEPTKINSVLEVSKPSEAPLLPLEEGLT